MLGGTDSCSGKCTRIADATARPRPIARRWRVSASCHRKGPASRRARGNLSRPKPAVRCSASVYPRVAPSSQRCSKRSENQLPSRRRCPVYGKLIGHIFAAVRALRRWILLSNSPNAQRRAYAMQIAEKSRWQEAVARVCRTATSACDSRDSEGPIVKKVRQGTLIPTKLLSTAANSRG